MKCTILLLLVSLLLNNNLYAPEDASQDPFNTANMFYEDSNWNEAYFLYEAIHKNIDAQTIKENIDHTALIRGHVNFADVLFAKGANEYNQGNIEKAKEFMLLACKHWRYRLLSGKFGRFPLKNEWDGSDLTNKTLVVYSERDNGAFGDTFFMTAMLKYVKEKGAHVIFIPQKHLVKLYDSYHLPSAEQTKYVDQIVLRDEQLPQHDYAIYLWSILKYYLTDTTIERPFPIKPFLSGTQFSDERLSKKIAELSKEYGHEPFLIGMWWRSSNPNAMAADWRMLERDPGIQKMLGALQGLSVLIINLEGLGRIPLSKEEYKYHKKNGSLGIADFVDMTTYSTDNVFNFDHNFDKEISFGDTIAVMQMIKEKGGVLIGPDTGLCMVAASTINNNLQCSEPSVFAILNKQADFRWSNDITSPRSWHHSDDVIIFQAPIQGAWDQPLAQARTVIKQRIQKFLQT